MKSFITRTLEILLGWSSQGACSTHERWDAYEVLVR